jgi:hypothetical protein
LALARCVLPIAFEAVHETQQQRILFGPFPLSGANLNGVDLSQALLGYAIFADVDLSTAKGLETVKHDFPSSIGIDTIYKSHGNIPEIFLRRAGVPEPFITNLRALVDAMSSINFYSCFISYSSKDQDFAERLYADLQSRGVRCWFASHAMKTGDKIRARIDESIRMYDKLLLVLSEHALASPWVEHEIEMALAKERQAKRTVLFPIRLDNTIFEISQEGWPKAVRHTRQIGNFERWKDHDQYQRAFQRLLRDLEQSARHEKR